MEIFSKDKTIDVEALKLRLLGRKTIQPRFRLDMTAKQAEDILLAAYQAEVEFRHRAFLLDEPTVLNVRKLAAYLTGECHKFGVMLCGICGNGKTTMLYAFRSALLWLSDCGAFNPSRKRITVVDAKEVQQYARDQKAFQDLRQCELLAVEDMGREPLEVLDYGNVLNPVVDLLEYRYNNQLFTFITTNLRADEIRKKYGDRIADRFNEMLEVIVFGGDTYRK